MTVRLSLEKLKVNIEGLGAAMTTGDANDGSYIDCAIKRDNLELYVIFTLFNDRYYAYSLNSLLAPSELYMDLHSDAPDGLAARDEEICTTVINLLSGKVAYHKKPSIFNKRRGYVELPVDGTMTRLSQKNNYFKLPEVD
jgi:hypothetical protein